MAKQPTEYTQYLGGMSNEQICHLIFHSFRGGQDKPKGMRLTWLGYNILKDYFRPYDIDVPADYLVTSRDLIYLDRRAKMPYYVGKGPDGKGAYTLVVFEPSLGILLKLADGMISNLRNMES